MTGLLVHERVTIAKRGMMNAEFIVPRSSFRTHRLIITTSLVIAPRETLELSSIR